MSKLIYTAADGDLLESLATVLGTTVRKIKHYIQREEFILASDIDSINVRLFISEVTEQDPKDIKLSDYEFDSIIVSHLTSRLTYEDLRQQPIYNLVDALIRKTDLSCFMRNFDISFQEFDGRIKTLYKGKIVDWDYYIDDGNPTAGMLKNRLQGSSSGYVDKCVNGFLFGGPVYEHSDVTHLMRCPEIVQNICEVLLGEKRAIRAVEDWESKSRTYVIEFVQAIDDVRFSDNEELNKAQKISKIYRLVLWYLSRKSLRIWEQEDNIMVFLDENLHVDENFIVSINEI